MNSFPGCSLWVKIRSVHWVFCCVVFCFLFVSHLYFLGRNAVLGLLPSTPETLNSFSSFAYLNRLRICIALVIVYSISVWYTPGAGRQFMNYLCDPERLHLHHELFPGLQDSLDLKRTKTLRPCF